MAKNILTKIEANNLGPHLGLGDSFPMSKLKLGIFANNGTGKTFLSRAFRLIENNDAEHVNKILTINQSQGHFKLKISEQQENTTIHKTLSINFVKDQIAKISNDTGYNFHVFNSDYVKENIEELKYQPSGEIEGYILGKTKIDLTKEKKKVELLVNEIQNGSKILVDAVKDAKKELDKQKINKGTKEYKFSARNVYDGDLDYVENKTYEYLVESNKVLSSTPDDLKDIQEIKYISKSDFLDFIETLLVTKYTKSEIAQSFKDNVLSKQDFVESGLKLLSNNLGNETECPFCEQLLMDEAIELIKRYNEYLEDSEALVNADIKKAINSINSFDKNLQADDTLFLKTKKDFDLNKKYIPSISDQELVEPNKIELSQNLAELKKLLGIKLNDIELQIKREEFEEHLGLIKKQVEEFDENESINNKIIKDYNLKKDNLKSEKLEINRRLCKAMYIKTRKEQKTLIDKIKSLNSEKKDLESEISNKESQERVSKKAKVLESLKKHLKNFFGNKYSIDDDFCFKFNKHTLTDNATDVLSDGEKSIVAFCHYLADVHKVVNRDEDYGKLFFVIDDPISSLDFHYVYAISQTIRNLHKTLDVERVRFIVMTHNLEFMSILIRNKIIDIPLMLANQKLLKLSRQLVMPYEEHLRDVYNVATGGKPSHTTPNSVRHVLETINKFEAPDKLLQDYCDNNELLGDNEFIYSLMHDGSHGGVRSQIAYTDEMIQKGCNVLINFVKSKFEGQINQIMG